MVVGVTVRMRRAISRGEAEFPNSSAFGNSQRCALTTPAGRLRTRKRPRCSTTNAAKRRAVEGFRRGKLGRLSARPVAWAIHWTRTGQTGHFGCAGVQTIAPSSIRAWFNLEQARLFVSLDRAATETNSWAN